MRVDQAVRSLRATRTYAPTPIDDERVGRWVDAARWCGSSKNSQPWRFVAVRDRESLRRLSGMGDFARHLSTCQLALVLVAAPGPYPFSRAFDLGRVAQSLMLLAHEDGVGSCVAVLEPRANLIAAGGLVRAPEGWSAELAIGFGHPVGENASSGPSPRGRLPTAELLFWETFPARHDALR